MTSMNNESFFHIIYGYWLYVLHFFTYLFCDFPIVEFNLNSETAKVPIKGTTYSAGYDLSSDVDITLLPWEYEKVETNVSVDMKNSPLMYARVAPRSGLALKGIHVGGGVIDSDYRGTIGVILYNLSNEKMNITKEQRVAQLIFERKAHPSIKNEEVVEKSREGGGFGSTGN